MLTNDRNLLFAATTGGVIVYDTRTNTPLSQVDVSAGGFGGYANRPDGLKTSENGDFLMIVTEEGIEIRKIDGTLIFEKPKSEYHAQTSVDISSDGSLAAISTCRDEFGHVCQTQVWDVSNDDLIFEHPG